MFGWFVKWDVKLDKKNEKGEMDRRVSFLYFLRIHFS